MLQAQQQQIDGYERRITALAQQLAQQKEESEGLLAGYEADLGNALKAQSESIEARLEDYLKITSNALSLQNDKLVTRLQGHERRVESLERLVTTSQESDAPDVTSALLSQVMAQNAVFADFASTTQRYMQFIRGPSWYIDAAKQAAAATAQSNQRLSQLEQAAR